jgi:hypothetical protein
MSLPLVGGCVRADFEVVLLPDGSGAVECDVAYSARKWPAFFGDPYASFTSPSGFRELMPPGFVAWAEPEISASEGWRRLRTAVFFEDIRRVVFPARLQGEPYAAMRFEGNPAEGDITLVCQLDSILARPVPLPSPQEIGMDAVSIPDAVMDGLRAQMGTILSGLDVSLSLTAPGVLLQADGFDRIEMGRGVIRVEASRGAAAFQQRAGVLVDADALGGENPRWIWTPVPPDPRLVAALRERREAALAWWQN